MWITLSSLKPSLVSGLAPHLSCETEEEVLSTLKMLASLLFQYSGMGFFSFLLLAKTPALLFFPSLTLAVCWQQCMCYRWQNFHSCLVTELWTIYHYCGDGFSILLRWDWHWENILGIQVSLLLPLWWKCRREHCALSSDPETFAEHE